MDWLDERLPQIRVGKSFVSTDETDPFDETDPIDETDPTNETDPTEETDPVDETDSSDEKGASDQGPNDADISEGTNPRWFYTEANFNQWLVEEDRPSQGSHPRGSFVKKGGDWRCVSAEVPGPLLQNSC